MNGERDGGVRAKRCLGKVRRSLWRRRAASGGRGDGRGGGGIE